MSGHIWVWLKIKQEGLRRFWSMFPLSRVPFGYRFFEPQPYVTCMCCSLYRYQQKPKANQWMFVRVDQSASTQVLHHQISSEAPNCVCANTGLLHLNRPSRWMCRGSLARVKSTSPLGGSIPLGVSCYRWTPKMGLVLFSSPSTHQLQRRTRSGRQTPGILSTRTSPGDTMGFRTGCLRASKRTQPMCQTVG